MITTSVFEMFKIGLGPSASHTTGPMLAAAAFREHLMANQHHERTVALKVVLHGSLAATGRGHATDRAVIAGLMGQLPSLTSSDELERTIRRVIEQNQLSFGNHPVPFQATRDIHWRPATAALPHPNTVDFVARGGNGRVLLSERYISVGGGFVELVHPDGTRQPVGSRPKSAQAPPYSFKCAADLGRLCRQHSLSWSAIALRNEQSLHGRNESEILEQLQQIWRVMRECITRGIHTEGLLPGPLQVSRRAPSAYRAATEGVALQRLIQDPLELLAHAYALAVNEENAAGHKVVSAPTNGAAGVLPAAFAAFQDARRVTDDVIARGLLTAGLIGAVVKAHSSLSGAEVGCQGEVGSAAAMAAGGLVEMAGGTPAQVEMAAEICIEHHLGMTCDPVGGLVQMPCIERNVMGAVKALNAATLAMSSDGQHKISLDAAIEAMRQIGHDMHSKYKETSRGGLAKVLQHDVAHVEC